LELRAMQACAVTPSSSTRIGLVLSFLLFSWSSASGIVHWLVRLNISIMLSSLFALVGLLAASVAGQSSAYTDAGTGITFQQIDESDESAPGGFQYGIALPAVSQTQYQNEFIGHISSGLTNGAGYGAISVGSSMQGYLLLLFWPNGNTVMHSLRFST
jgi:hypothetical protein